MIFRYLLIILCGLSNVHAEEIKVAVGMSLPPYTIQEKNSGKELDIVMQALTRAGYTMKPVYLPFGRISAAIHRGEVDAAMTVNEGMGIQDIFFSENHINYHNVAVTLSKYHFKIDRVEDMASYSVVAFQNAKAYLGDAFKNMADHNAYYNEYAQQVQQNIMLYAERVQVVISDRHIFDYYNKEAKQRGANIDQNVTYHEIFPEIPYKVGFRQQVHRDAFNVALAQMRRDGSYSAIMKKY